MTEQEWAEEYRRRMYGIWGGTLNWLVWGLILAIKFTQHPIAFFAVMLLPAIIFYKAGSHIWKVKDETDTSGFPLGCLIHSVACLIAGIGTLFALYLWDSGHHKKLDMWSKRFILTLRSLL